MLSFYSQTSSLAGRRRILLCLIITVLWFPGQGGSQTHSKLSINYENFLIHFSPEHEKTGHVIMRLLEQHIPALEKFYQIHISERINILVADSRTEFQEYGQYQLPSWAAAAYISSHHIILVKSPAWAGSLTSLENEIVHELSHLYYEFKFGSVQTPLWYNEGLAQYLSGKRIGMFDAIKISNAVLSGNIIYLSDIDSLLHFPQPQAELAYLESLSAILFMSEYLRDNQWPQFNNLIRDVGWENALQNQLGMDAIEFEIVWLRFLENKYRWLALLNFDNLLWLLFIIVLL